MQTLHHSVGANEWASSNRKYLISKRLPQKKYCFYSWRWRTGHTWGPLLHGRSMAAILPCWVKNQSPEGWDQQIWAWHFNVNGVITTTSFVLQSVNKMYLLKALLWKQMAGIVPISLTEGDYDITPNAFLSLDYG